MSYTHVQVLNKDGTTFGQSFGRTKEANQWALLWYAEARSVRVGPAEERRSRPRFWVWCDNEACFMALNKRNADLLITHCSFCHGRLQVAE